MANEVILDILFDVYVVFEGILWCGMIPNEGFIMVKHDIYLVVVIILTQT